MSDRALELFEHYLEQRASGERPIRPRYVAEAGDEADHLAGMIATYPPPTPPT